MESKIIIIPGFGSIRLKLEKTKLIATSIPEEIRAKFKKQYPDGVIGNVLDYINEKRLGEVLTKMIKSLQ
jgi:hypothetical protein